MMHLLKVNDKRIELMKAGARELELWLLDLIRQGLVVLDHNQEEFWEEIASRMVNAKLGSLARRIRLLKRSTENRVQWQENILKEVAYLYLVAKSMQQFDRQNEARQCELLRICGVNVDKKKLEQEKGIDDTWLVIHQEFGNDEQLNYRRLWLYGEKSQELALLLDFLWNSTDFFPDYEFGALYKGEVIYYPGAGDRRALFKQAVPHRGTFQGKGGMDSLQQLTYFFAKALERNPWLETYPCLLNQMQITRKGKAFMIVDQARRSLPLDEASESGWKLLALSMDQPLNLFGFWDGRAFRPVSAFALNRLIRL